MKIQEVEPIDGYRLYVKFEDGTEGEVALADRLFGPMFEPLRALDLFSRVYVDNYGVICWPNGADLAPDALYDNLIESSAKTADSLDRKS